MDLQIRCPASRRAPLSVRPALHDPIHRHTEENTMGVIINASYGAYSYDNGTYTDIGAQGELLVYNKDDVKIAIYHRDHWLSALVEVTKAPDE